MRWLRRAVWASLVLLAIGAGAAVMHSADHGSRDPVRDIAAELSCPSCAGQSVAESDSPVAAGMRQAIADQLSRGRSPDQVRQWFVERYGPEVLRTDRRGIRALLWVIPVAVVAAVAVGAASGMRRRRGGDPGEVVGGSRLRVGSRAAVLTVSTLVVAVVAGVVVAAWWVERPAAEPTALARAQTLERSGDFGAAAEAYRQAGRDDDNPAIRLRMAFALLRAGQPDAATAAAKSVQANAPDDPDALLILGLAQRASADPQADQTLRRFLALVPTHPAATEVRRLLASHG